MERICQTSVSFERRVVMALMAGGLFFAFLILFMVPPADLPLTTCAFHSITGHSCLTCGMTRSLHAISQGELAASIRYHLMGPAVFLGMLLCFALFTAEAISGRKPVIRADRKIRNRAIVVFAAVWLVYWGVRLAAECVA